MLSLSGWRAEKIYTDVDEKNVEVDIENRTMSGAWNCQSTLTCIKLCCDRLRLTIVEIVDSPSSRFDSFILAVIVLNSITMALVDYSNVDENYEPVTKGSMVNLLINRCEIVFVCIFVTECLFKIIAYGFLRGQNSYLRRDGWNIIDFVIILAR